MRKAFTQYKNDQETTIKKATTKRATTKRATTKRETSASMSFKYFYITSGEFYVSE